jgi:hypothetical protein
LGKKRFCYVLYSEGYDKLLTNLLHLIMLHSMY